MKKLKITLGILLLLLFSTSYGIDPNCWGGKKQHCFWRHWSVNLHTGFTSYYGDLSQYDHYIGKKLHFESHPSIGLKITKQVNSKLTVSGQALYGGFKSDYKKSHAFNTELVEYNIQAGINVMNLIKPDNTTKLDLLAYFGVGQVLFRVNKAGNYDVNNGGQVHYTGVPEFVYFMGGTLQYDLSEKFNLTADLSLRQAQNDNLDAYIAKEDFDYYSHLSFGISYNIDYLLKPFQRKLKRAQEGMVLTQRR